MGFEQELARTNYYIENFDPQEFSTGSDFLDNVDEALQKKRAEKVRARLQRRRQMEQKFLNIELCDDYNASDVMVTQEQIDALLNKT